MSAFDLSSHFPGVDFMPSLSYPLPSPAFGRRGEEMRGGEDKDEAVRGLWLIRTHTALRRDLHRPPRRRLRKRYEHPMQHPSRSFASRKEGEEDIYHRRRHSVSDD